MIFMDDDKLLVIGSVEAINRVLKSINPNYPRQNLENLEKNDCYYVMNGVNIEIIVKK